MVVVTSFIWTFCASLIFNAIYNVESQDDLSENVGVTVTVFLTVLKLMNLILKRKTIVSLLNMLGNEPCLPIDATDKQIFAKFDKLTE